MKFLRSIRFKIAVWFVLALLFIVALFSVFIYTRQIQALKTTAAARLELKVRRLGETLRFSEEENREHAQPLLPSNPSQGLAFLQDSDALALLTTGGQLVQSWGEANPETVQALLAQINSQNKANQGGENDYLYTQLPGAGSNANYVFLLQPVRLGEGFVGYYLIGTPVDPEGQLSRLAITLAAGLVITLAVALLGGFWLANQVIHPVEQITHTARTISETDLSRRLGMAQQDEIGELADTFDEMLGRLEAGFERQRRFTADASHELRTPLTIIDLEAGRALAAPRPAQEYARALQVIHSENQFMIRLVNNLLTLARMDSGQIVLQKEQLDLSDVALEVVERLAPVANLNQVRLTAGELPYLPVSGDRQFLAQMLSNLVENAIKYSSGGDKQVWVSAGKDDTQQPALTWVRVSDNGLGIPAEHLAHLFDRFYQVDEARTRRSGDEAANDQGTAAGAGLGLSIAQWIAHAHQGEIRVRSTPGEGSIFEFVLPLPFPNPQSL